MIGWANLTLNSWAGQTKQRVIVLAYLGKGRCRIRAIERTKIAGRNRWLEPGEEGTVPSSALNDVEVKED